MTAAPVPTTGRRVEIEAPAKVNLVLRVLERDEDTGYHRLETVFQAVDLADRLVISMAAAGEDVEAAPSGPAVELTVSGADVGPVEDNLVTRAARAFVDAAGLAVALRIRLEKRIPAGAGLGGGSSDAAATLRALNVLFGGPASPSELHRIGASLGADVPFFLGGSPTALGRDRGDRLRPLRPLPARPLVLVLPGVHVSTGEAYRALDRWRVEEGGPGGAAKVVGGGGGIRPGLPEEATTGRAPGPPARLDPPEEPDWAWVARNAANDFEAVVPGTHPPVARALEEVRATGAPVALLCGSGSAVFAVYHGEGEADAAARGLRERGHRVVRGRTLERMPGPGLREGAAWS